MAFTSIGYDGTVNERQWAELVPNVGSSIYGVKGAGDLKVSAVPGQPLMVSVAAGTGWGHGVMDTEVANTTITCDAISSGIRWDLIAVRRNWQPLAGGPTSVVKVTGTADQVIPDSRKAEPGVEDDQPLALVQWTAGQTQPTNVIDLRCWAGIGGVIAKDTLALTYLAQLGASVKIGVTEWNYTLGANDMPAWIPGPSIQNIAFTPENGYSFIGQLTKISDGTFSRAHLVGKVTRTVSGGPNLSATWFRVMTTFLPASALPAQNFPADTYANLSSGLDQGGNPIVVARVNVAIKNDRSFWARLDSGSYTWPQGGYLYVDMSWPL